MIRLHSGKPTTKGTAMSIRILLGLLLCLAVATAQADTVKLRADHPDR